MVLCEYCGFEKGGVLCKHYRPCPYCSKPVLVKDNIGDHSEASVSHMSCLMEATKELRNAK